MVGLQNDLVFKKDLPFYRMVSTFMVAISGCPAVFRADNPMSFDQTQTIELTGIVHHSRSIYPYHIHRNAVDGFVTTDQFKYDLCMMLAIRAYESVKHQNTGMPEFEFFRHVRNASAHGNIFTFNAREPHRFAAWSGIEIDESLKGESNTFSGRACFGYVLGVADLLLLLHDIEGQL